jgi:hypothetical protein
MALLLTNSRITHSRYLKEPGLKIVRVVALWMDKGREDLNSTITLQCGVDDNWNVVVRQWMGFSKEKSIRYPFIFDPVDRVFDYGYESAVNERMATTFGEEPVAKGSRFKTTEDIRTGSNDTYEYKVSSVDVIVEGPEA